jgi:hypothetical protein
MSTTDIRNKTSCKKLANRGFDFKPVNYVDYHLKESILDNDDYLFLTGRKSQDGVSLTRFDRVGNAH